MGFDIELECTTRAVFTLRRVPSRSNTLAADVHLLMLLLESVSQSCSMLTLDRLNVGVIASAIRDSFLRWTIAFSGYPLLMTGWLTTMCPRGSCTEAEITCGEGGSHGGYVLRRVFTQGRVWGMCMH